MHGPVSPHLDQSKRQEWLGIRTVPAAGNRVGSQWAALARGPGRGKVPPFLFAKSRLPLDKAARDALPEIDPPQPRPKAHTSTRESQARGGRPGIRPGPRAEWFESLPKRISRGLKTRRGNRVGAAVARITGIARSTIGRGLAELRGEAEPDAARGRVRRKGGGRRPLVVTDPTLLADLRALVEPTTRGDSTAPLLWTAKSLRNLAAGLWRLGHRISHNVSRLNQERDAIAARSLHRTARDGGGGPSAGTR
jgi:hypothetical protein